MMLVSDREFTCFLQTRKPARVSAERVSQDRWSRERLIAYLYDEETDRLRQQLAATLEKTESKLSRTDVA